MKRKLLSSLIAFVGILSLSAGSAFAWTYGLSGQGACQDDGSYKITWTLDNTAESQTLTVKSSSNTSVVPTGTQVTAGHKAYFTETENGSAPKTYSLTLNVVWPGDQSDHIKTASVTLQDACTQGGQGGGGNDVTLCHATDSMTNPYVRITVDAAGAYHGHYLQHQGPVFPGTGGKWGDIIPTFTYSDHSYSLNWDTAGQAIYNAGCVTGGQGGGTLDCDNDMDNSPSTECAQQQKDCDGDYDSSPTTEAACAGGQGGGGGTTTTTPTAPTTTATTTTAATTTVTTGGQGGGEAASTPSGGVNAGEGGGTKLSTVSLAGLLSSLVATAFGLRRYSKQF